MLLVCLLFVPSIFRYDWYQTDSQVVIAIMIKKTNKEGVKVDYTEKAVSTVSVSIYLYVVCFLY